MGTVEFFFCLVYLAIMDKKARFTYICTLLIAGMIIYVNIENLLTFYKIDSISRFFNEKEARYNLITRMSGDFKSNILFGRGLGYTGNEDLYSPVKGAMHWYHMMIPQIIGSLGITGVIAYIVQWAIRARTIFYKTNAYLLVLGLSYFGLFLMSQVNPGKFCPMPYSMLAVITFVMAENHAERAKIKSGE
ncbi:hypothetical protein EOM82_05510 [bacterium]|nr:hypothetical protein [bacterium]